MGAGKFLRDFRRDYNIKKTIAHRKAVFQRKKKADEKKDESSSTTNLERPKPL